MRLCEQDFKNEKFEEDEHNTWKIFYFNKERERNERFEINRLSQSQENKPKAMQIQMATVKLGQRRLLNSVYSALKNPVESTSHRSPTRPIISSKDTKVMKVRSCSKGMKVMNKIIKDLMCYVFNE